MKINASGKGVRGGRSQTTAEPTGVKPTGAKPTVTRPTGGKQRKRPAAALNGGSVDQGASVLAAAPGVESDDAQKSHEYVLRAAQGRNVKFVRLWFTDILGMLKSTAIIAD